MRAEFHRQQRDDISYSDTGRSEDEDLELNSQLDELLMTLDDEPTDFDPKEHWVSCYGRLCYELNPCQNWCLVEDPPFTGRTLDIPVSFAPTGPCPTFGKSMALISVIGILVWSLLAEENKGFFFAYLSTWNLFFALIYTACSLKNSLRGVPQPFSRVNGTVRGAWYFFVVVAHCGVVEFMLYWFTDFDPDEDKVDFRTIMLHGGITLQVILDGFTVNVIPLRWMHWWGCCLPVLLLYVGWTLIHGFFTYIGNPDKDDRNSIYELLDWRFHAGRAMATTFLGIFLISPLVFLALWMMSLYKWFLCCCWRRERRRYLQQTRNMDKYSEQAAKKASGEEEEGSAESRHSATLDSTSYSANYGGGVVTENRGALKKMKV